MCGGKEEKLTKDEVIMILKLVLDIHDEQAMQIYQDIDTKNEGSVTYCKYSHLLYTSVGLKHSQIIKTDSSLYSPYLGNFPEPYVKYHCCHFVNLPNNIISL